MSSTAVDQPVVPSDVAESSKDSSKDSGSLEDSSERETWDSKWDFFLVLAGYAIGLGNLWRFPLMVAKYGGGAFLIPYFLCLGLIAAPLYFAELSIGQLFQAGPRLAFGALDRHWHGIGFATAILVTVVCAYYNLLIVYALIYMGRSVEADFPWIAPPTSGPQFICQLDMSYGSCSIAVPVPAGANFSQSNCTVEYVKSMHDPTPQAFFRDDVLGQSAAIDSSDALDLHGPLVAGLFCLVVFEFLAMVKGIKSSGKVVYFTVTMPFLCVFLLFWRVIVLDGASEGISFYLHTDLARLGEIEVWSAAAGQILFSLSPAMGTAVALASYNKKDTDVYLITMAVAGLNSLFSFFGGFVIFSTVGYMAKQQCVEVESLAKSGTGLAFIVYAEALTLLGDGSHFFSFIFFFTLFLLGVDSSIAWLENLNTCILDELRIRDFKDTNPTMIAAVSSVLIFLLGLPFATKGGLYYLDVFDHFSCTYVLLVIAVLEGILIGWIYGAERLVADIEEMLPHLSLSRFWALNWKYINPFLVTVLLIMGLAKEAEKPYEGYPTGYQIMGWLAVAMPLVVIPLAALYPLPRTAAQAPTWSNSDGHSVNIHESKLAPEPKSDDAVVML